MHVVESTECVRCGHPFTVEFTLVIEDGMLQIIGVISAACPECGTTVVLDCSHVRLVKRI